MKLTVGCWDTCSKSWGPSYSGRKCKGAWSSVCLDTTKIEASSRWGVWSSKAKTRVGRSRSKCRSRWIGWENKRKLKKKNKTTSLTFAKLSNTWKLCVFPQGWIQFFHSSIFSCTTLSKAGKVQRGKPYVKHHPKKNTTPQLLQDPERWPGQGLNPRPPSRYYCTLPAPWE